MTSSPQGLWDAWVHERDVCIPLRIEQPVEADEASACLEFVAGLGPAMLAMDGSTRADAFVIDSVDPADRVVVEIGANILIHDGDAPPARSS